MNELIQNAVITSTMLGYEDHGILTFWITVKGSGWGVSIGGNALDAYSEQQEERIATGIGFQAVTEVMNVVGVEKWEDLKGKYIRVKSEGIGKRVSVIGNLMEDKWFDIDSFFKEAE